jgi:hypothetical protein
MDRTDKLTCALAQDKPIAKWIGRVDQEFVAAGDVGRALHLWDDSRVRAKRRRFNDAPAEAAADDALDDDGLVQVDLAPCVVDGQAAADARAGWAAIHFAFGKDAHVATVCPCSQRRPDKDRAVEKA